MEVRCCARACVDRGDFSRKHVDGERLKNEKKTPVGYVYSPLQEAGKVATKSARNRAGMRIYKNVCACERMNLHACVCT